MTGATHSLRKWMGKYFFKVTQCWPIRELGLLSSAQNRYTKWEIRWWYWRKMPAICQLWPSLDKTWHCNFRPNFSNWLGLARCCYLRQGEDAWNHGQSKVSQPEVTEWLGDNKTMIGLKSDKKACQGQRGLQVWSWMDGLTKSQVGKRSAFAASPKSISWEWECWLKR